MDMRALLVDDDASCLDALRSALKLFPQVTVTAAVPGGREALPVLHQGGIDLVFLDIEMEEFSGFELARHIHTVYPNVLFIFLTGHVDFALEGYEYAPVDFLVKPVNPLRLERALHRAEELLAGRREYPDGDERIGIRTNSGVEFIPVADIFYVEKKGRKIFLVDTSGRRHPASDSLQKLEDILEPYEFFRCHQSFLIPLHKIRRIGTDEIRGTYQLELDGLDQTIPVSREKYSELRGLLMQRYTTVN